MDEYKKPSNKLSESLYVKSLYVILINFFIF